MLGAITGAVGALGGLIQGGLNYDLQKKQFEYQKQLQQQIFEREDNAVQRRANDMANAGLSKTLAAGGAASAGPVVQTQAPQLSGMDSVGDMSGAGLTDANTAVAKEREKLVSEQVNTEQQQQKTLRANANLADSNAQKNRVDSLVSLYNLGSSMSQGLRVGEKADMFSLLRGAINSAFDPWKEEKSAFNELLDQFSLGLKK